MRDSAILNNTISSLMLFSIYFENQIFVKTLSLFQKMNAVKCLRDLLTCNVMINLQYPFWVCDEARLFDEAMHPFPSMQRMNIAQNEKSLEHEKGKNLVKGMQNKGIEPKAITYSTLKCLDNSPRYTAIAILVGAGQIEEVTWLFHQAIEAGDAKDMSLFGCMVDLYSRNKNYANVIEVFEKIRDAGYFSDSNIIALVLNPYGKLQDFEMANAMYREMQDEGCVFQDIVEKLNSYPNINNKELLLVVASDYKRANRLNYVSPS
ncbi:Pentatricopeptide repeat [Dillenia turbinata]|uniref:Pentatricopeptide repeat n=1 Tax=Dillenia turbinata TaxID=194707 RepID=A0AAN8UD39_9MAGN